MAPGCGFPSFSFLYLGCFVRFPCQLCGEAVSGLLHHVPIFPVYQSRVKNIKTMQMMRIASVIAFSLLFLLSPVTGVREEVSVNDPFALHALRTPFHNDFKRLRDQICSKCLHACRHEATEAAVFYAGGSAVRHLILPWAFAVPMLMLRRCRVW